MNELDHLGQWEEFLWLQGLHPGLELGDGIFLVCMSEDIKQYNHENDPNHTSRALGCL
jgi:hypothetical protein